MIYDTQELPNFNNKKIYYYIMEKMRPINSLDQFTYQNIRSVIATIYNNVISDFVEVGKLKENMDVNEISKFIMKNIIKFKKIITDKYGVKFLKSIKQDNTTLKDNWFELLVEEISIKLLTGRNDLHGGNIGLTNFGEFRFFDSIV